MKARTRYTIALLVAALSLAACTGGISQEEADSISDELSRAVGQRDALQSELEQTVQNLDFSAATARELSEALDSVRGELEAAERRRDEAEELLSTASTDLDATRSELRTTQSELRDANELIAQLSMAYNAGISSALATVFDAASDFACSTGSTTAADGRPMSVLTSNSLRSGFLGSDTYDALQQQESVSAALEVARTLGVDFLGVEDGSLRSRAEACWQTEDKKQNAALYAYQDVLRAAVLDAACTLGASNAFDDSWATGFGATAVFQDWYLRQGSESAIGYLRDVEERFGSFEEFIAIAESDVQAEDERCEAIRETIEPKGSGTWNVGDEIRPGDWIAIDESDCYWARLAENGAIRDNHFGDGLRLSVNVRSTDGQFEISGCTFYYKNP